MREGLGRHQRQGGLLDRSELVYDDPNRPSTVGIYAKLLDVIEVDLVVEICDQRCSAPAMPVVAEGVPDAVAKVQISARYVDPAVRSL